MSPPCRINQVLWSHRALCCKGEGREVTDTEPGAAPSSVLGSVLKDHLFLKSNPKLSLGQGLPVDAV